MTFDTFIVWAKKQNATILNYDNTYGLQCVDLVKWYIKKVRGIEPQSIGNAIEYYNKRDCSYVKAITEGGKILTYKKSDKPKPHKGDIVVFYNENNKSTGHIAVATGKNTDEGFYSYDTNFVNQDDKYDKCELVLHKYTSTCWCICLLRMSSKYVEGIEYKKTTANLNAYSNTKYGDVAVVIPKGTKIQLINSNVGTMTKNGKNYKMCTVKYNGKTYYVASMYLN
jgi:hypothetical protein